MIATASPGKLMVAACINPFLAAIVSNSTATNFKTGTKTAGSAAEASAKV
jgi:hypothetical protein